MKTSLLLVSLVVGCGGREPMNPTDQSRGHALLYRHLVRDAQADKLLWLKLESDALDALMAKIVSLCKEGTTMLAREPARGARFEGNILPRIEREAREGIGSEKARELLLSSGPEFERRLLMTQDSALHYAEHLTRALAAHEAEEAYAQELTGFADRCSTLRDEVLRAILP